MSDINTSPVSLPAGSFDLGALQKSLDKAAKGAADKYDGAVDRALKDAGTGLADARDARDIPGYKFVDVENKDLGVTENVQVFDAKLAKQAEKDGSDTGAIPEADLRNQQAEATAEAVAKAPSPSKE